MVDLSLLQDFIAETAEYLEDMEGCLLRLESDSDNPELLEEIFRPIHTIKGAAEYLGIESITELSRTIENLLYHHLHSDKEHIDRELVKILADSHERLTQLTRNLQHENPDPVAIDDLLDRLRIFDTSSRISEEIRKVAGNENGNTQDDSGEAPAIPGIEEDEYDEELFAIFLEQMEEKLTQIHSQLAGIRNPDESTQLTGLENCLALIEPLRAAANYMGYDHLTVFYDQWEEKLIEARKQFENDKTAATAECILCIENNIKALMSRYPQLHFPQPSAPSPPLEATPAPTETAAIHPASDKETLELDSNEDDILEQYASDPTPSNGDSESTINKETNDDQDSGLFERLSWSFDNRIKQSPGIQNDNDLAEIEAKLFSDPKATELPAASKGESKVREQTISAEPITESALELPPTPASASPIEPLPEIDTGPIQNVELPDIKTILDDYREENDSELFTIFQELLGEVLGDLALQAETLANSSGQERIAILDHCRKQIERLHSAANYMSYKRLTAFYDTWMREINQAQTRLENGEEGFFPGFVTSCLTARTLAIASLFPEITLPRPDSAATAQTITTADSPQIPTNEVSLDSPQTSEDSTGSEKSSSTAQTPINDLSMLPDFITETREHLEEMEENLLLLDNKSDNREVLDNIFRSVHTIKGAAEYLGINRLATLTHNLENLLYQLRQNDLNINQEIIDLLMAGWDRISLLTRDLEEKQHETADIDDLLERIRTLGNTSETLASKPEDKSQLSASEQLSALPLSETTSDVPTTTPTTEPSTPPRQTESDALRPPEKSVKRSIRVEAGKIDALMNQVGELVVSRAGFTQILTEMLGLQQELKQNTSLDLREIRRITGLANRLGDTTTLFEKVINELQEEVMKVRMLPISQLFNRYPRLVYDLVRNTGKKVKLDIEGAETELDKMVIEEISDPLIHIIRNAVDHGIETVEERREKGKPETGTIRLKAYHEGNHVIIEIMDDGRGLDLDHIKQKALKGNFASATELAKMSPQEITSLIMKPGFSTAAKVTHISGRGVGMDVVRKNIEKLNGTIEIDTTPGVEILFRIKIPLTLAIIPALRVRVGRELFTIPLSTVEETLKISWNEVFTIEGLEVLSYRETTLPLIRLLDLFKLETNKATDTLSNKAYVVVVSTGMKRMGLVVDALLNQENVVIKPLEDYIQERSGFSGATILGDGRISLILDIYELINLAIERRSRGKDTITSVRRYNPGPVLS